MTKLKSAAIAATAILVMSACGGNTGNNTTTTSAPAAKEDGAAIYARACVACHQANGEGFGSTFPPLAKADYLADKDKAIGQVLKGSSGELVVNGKTFNNTMPPQQLNDDQVAAVLTYVYSNFGNSGGPITPDDVKKVRAKN